MCVRVRVCATYPCNAHWVEGSVMLEINVEGKLTAAQTLQKQFVETLKIELVYKKIPSKPWGNYDCHVDI